MSRRVRSRVLTGGSVDFDALANELRRGDVRELCSDIYGESEGVGQVASAGRSRRPEAGGAGPSPGLRVVEADCS